MNNPYLEKVAAISSIDDISRAHKKINEFRVKKGLPEVTEQEVADVFHDNRRAAGRIGWGLAGLVTPLPLTGPLGFLYGLSQDNEDAHDRTIGEYLLKSASRKKRQTPNQEIAQGALLAGVGSIGGRALHRETVRYTSGPMEAAIQAKAREAGNFGSKQYFDALRKGVKKQDLIRKLGTGAGKAIRVGGVYGGAAIAGHGLYRKLTGDN